MGTMRDCISSGPSANTQLSCLSMPIYSEYLYKLVPKKQPHWLGAGVSKLKFTVLNPNKCVGFCFFIQLSREFYVDFLNRHNSIV